MINLYYYHEHPTSLYGWGETTFKSDVDGIHHIRNGLYHRDDDEPAYIDADGKHHWYKNGKLHREGKPAVIGSSTQAWMWHGMKHRTDGPAVSSQHSNEWWVHGMRHRLDGPALEYAGDSSDYYVEGQYIRDNQLIRVIEKFKRDKHDLLITVRRKYPAITDIELDPSTFTGNDTVTDSHAIPVCIYMDEGDMFRAARNLDEIELYGTLYRFKAGFKP